MFNLKNDTFTIKNFLKFNLKMSLFLLIICLAFSNSLFSQTASSEIGNWFMYNGFHKISQKWGFETMAHFRYYEFSKNFQQEIYRLGANYTFAKNLNATIGYSYVTTDVLFGSPSSTIYENRIYEDINYSNFVNKLKIRHRFRFEHRFFNLNSVSTQSHWFRYDLNASYPIAKKWTLYVFNEIFLNMDKRKQFVQNWTGFGFLHPINSLLKLNLGYQQIKLPNETQKRVLLGIILNTNHIKNTL